MVHSIRNSEMRGRIHFLRTAILTAVCSFLLPGAALALDEDATGGGGEDKATGEVEKLLHDPRLEKERDGMAAFFEKVEAEGLPREPFVLKVREGLAKKVQPGKILGALGVLHGRYLEAAALLEESGASRSAGNLGAVADLLSAGVKGKQVKSLLAELKGREPAAWTPAMTAMTACVLKLVDEGEGAEGAVARTLELFKKGGVGTLRKEIAKKRKPPKPDVSKHSPKHGKGKKASGSGKAKHTPKVKGFGGKKGARTHGK